MSRISDKLYNFLYKSSITVAADSSVFEIIFNKRAVESTAEPSSSIHVLINAVVISRSKNVFPNETIFPTDREIIIINIARKRYSL